MEYNRLRTKTGNTNNFGQVIVTEFLIDARICWGEWQCYPVKQQWVLLDGVREVLCKAVTVVNKLVEIRIIS
jgi:hypothetical protein